MTSKRTILFAVAMLMQFATASPAQDWFPNPEIFSASPVVEGTTVLTMNPPSTVTKVEIHVGAANGPLLYMGEGAGNALAPDWVTDGTVFYLQDISNDQPRTLSNTIDTVTATRTGATFTANPPVILNPDAWGRGKLNLTYNVPGAQLVEIHLNSPDGQLFALLGGPSGTVTTGDWVGDGLTFWLCDVTSQPCSPATTAATLTAHVANGWPGSAAIMAVPNPIVVARGQTYGQAKLFYAAPDASVIEIHVLAPNGPLFARLGSTGSAITGPWVADGTKFFLQDVTEGSPGRTVAVTTARVVEALNISCWGDSLTFGAGVQSGLPFPAKLQELFPGSRVFNGGVGGQTSEQIAQRFLSDPGDVGDFAVIWAGRNNYGETSQILADVGQMVAALPNPKHFVVLSILNGEFPNEYAGQSGYTLIDSINEALRLAYPENFIDIREYLVSQYDSTKPKDLFDYAHDVPAASLRSDGIHLTEAGYALVAQKVADFISNQPSK